MFTLVSILKTAFSSTSYSFNLVSEMEEDITHDPAYYLKPNKCHTYSFFYGMYSMDIKLRHKRNCKAASTCAGCPSYSMNVVLWSSRYVVIYNSLIIGI